jgi:hypothetical protein
VRATEECCPFCQASLGAERVCDFAPQTTATRLARAALFALGTGTLAAGSSCDNTTLMPPYGAVPVLQPEGGEGAEDAASEATGAQVGDAAVAGGSAGDVSSDGATVDAEAEGGDAD